MAGVEAVAVEGAPSEDFDDDRLLLLGVGLGVLLALVGGVSDLSNQPFSVSASVAGWPGLPEPPPSSSRRRSPEPRGLLLSLRALLLLDVLELDGLLELELENEPLEELELEDELVEDAPLENEP